MSYWLSEQASSVGMPIAGSVGRSYEEVWVILDQLCCQRNSQYSRKDYIARCFSPIETEIWNVLRLVECSNQDITLNESLLDFQNKVPDFP